MTLTPYHVAVPLLSAFMVSYAWNLFMRQKKTLWEVLLWTVFWSGITVIALFPGVLGYLAGAMGIKSQVNAIFVTCIGILFFMVFYLVIRLEEVEQRLTRVVRSQALRDAGLPEKKTVSSPE